jgi:hypothetical protein
MHFDLLHEYRNATIGWTSTVRTDNAQKVRFSATLGEEPEVEIALV